MDRRRAPRSGPARAGLLAIASALAGVLLVVVPLASRAGAHATLIGTSPADGTVVDAVPERVELQFDEPVEVVDGGIRVIAPDGSRADRGQVDQEDGGATLAVPVDGAGEGTYTVAWRVISEDSHNLTGSFVFHVGVETGAADLEERSSTPADATGGIGRWLAFAGAFAVVGAVVVSAAIGATTPTTTPTAAAATARRRLRRLAVAGGVAGALGVALTLVAQAADATGRNLVDAIGDTLDIALDNRTGTIALWRLAALGAATLLAALPPLWRSPGLTVLPALAASGSLLAASISGHAWTAPNRELSVPVDVVHLVAAAVWLGGLLALVLVVRALPEGGAPPLVRRFSDLALGAAALVAVSGTVSAVVQVDSIDGLTSTGYGQLLTVKVAGFLVLVALGFVNRAVIVPKVEHALTSLLRSTRAELGVAALVLAVTAVLINQPPARSQAPSGPISLTVEAAEQVDARLQADVVPAEVGPNDIHLYFFAGDGTTPLAVDAVEITAAVGDIPPRRLDVTPVTPSHVSALDASLGTPGTWTIQVTASSAGRLATFTLEVPLR